MIEVKQLCGLMCIGKQGENLARIVYFDEITIWKEKLGEGRCELLHQRNGDSAPYPVKLDIEDGRVCWKITASDTAIVGDGKCELHYIIDDVIVKSKIWTTSVLESLGGDVVDAPDPQQSWVDEVLDAAQKVEDATVHPPIIGNNGDWWLWNFELSEYEDSGVSVTGGGGSSIIVDEELSETSENPVQNKVVTAALKDKASSTHKHKIADLEDYVVDEVLDATSTNPVQNKVIHKALNELNLNYKYKTADISGVVIPLEPNTITSVSGEEVTDGGVSFAFSRKENVKGSEETVLILDTSALTEKPYVMFPSIVKWFGGEPPVVEAGKVYLFSFTYVKESVYYLGIGGEFA